MITLDLDIIYPPSPSKQSEPWMDQVEGGTIVSTVKTTFMKGA